MSAETTSPAMGDLELQEIMDAVGADFGSTPVPPVVKTPAVAVVEEIPDVEVPDLDALADSAEEGYIEPSPEVIADAASEEDEELAALLASVPDTVDDDVATEVVDSPVVESLEETKEVPESEALFHKPEIKERLDRAIKAAETKVATESEEEVLLSSPYEEDDDDFKPVVKGGVTYYIDPARLKRDVAFSTVNIEEAMMTHASMYVHYGVQQSKARGQYERTKAAFEILESRLDNEHRLTLKEENPKTTEAQIRAAVVSDTRWRQGNARLIETRGIYDLASVALEAFSQRRDTLLQMAKTLREEQGSKMRLEEIREGSKVSADAIIGRMKAKAKAGKELGSETTQA